MRRLLLSVSLSALVAAACGGAASTLPPGRDTTGQHHQPPPVDPFPTRPYDGVTFEDPGVNPYVDPVEDRESTFALDVDTAAYGIARRFVADGYRPDPASVRVEEYVNAFEGGYSEPRDGTFAIHVDGAPSPFLPPDEVLLRIGIKAAGGHELERPPAALTFVIDTSGSMAREERLELVKEALGVLVDNLGPADSVAIVTFGSDAGIALGPTPATDRHRILDAIAELQPEGSTHLEHGLRLGYELARETLTENGIDRVVLASDGVANVGLTDPDGILDQVADDAAAGIELVAVGVGMGNYNDVLLERLADRGDGFYAYVNGYDEVRRLFAEDLTTTLQTVALDARIQIDFETDAVTAYRLLGYENRELGDDEFRDPEVDAGAIGAGHEITALYALRLREESWRSHLATIDLRWTDLETGRTDVATRDIDARDLAGSFRDAGSHLQLAALVAATAEVLRGSEWAAGMDLGDIAVEARALAHALPETDEVHEFLVFLDELERLDY